jgi:hypothetical protein
MTWILYPATEISGVVHVGCGGVCNAYYGDTSCDECLPILCVSKDKLNRPGYAMTGGPHAMPVEFYNGWSGGKI